MEDTVEYYRADFEYDADDVSWTCVITVNMTTYHGKGTKPIDAYELAERELKKYAELA